MTFSTGRRWDDDSTPEETPSEAPSASTGAQPLPASDPTPQTSGASDKWYERPTGHDLEPHQLDPNANEPWYKHPSGKKGPDVPAG